MLPSASEYELDPLFNEIYPALGGEASLGKLISPASETGNQRCQYTENVRMCAATDIPGIDRYTLSPLGSKLVEEEPPQQTDVEEPGDKIVEGYTIYPEFVDLYNSLFGERFAGKPISEPIYNVERSRVEQYFENVAMGYEDGSLASKAYLLALGVSDCAEACGHTPDAPKANIPANSSPFVYVLEDIGGKELSGEALTKPFEMDGMLVQIFKNVIVYQPLDGSKEQALYPITRPMGMYQNDPVEKKYDQKENMIFYPVAGELGYHVPLEFDAFVFGHGGLTHSGAPIAEVVQYPDGAYRQCFETYCMDYDYQSGNERVRPYPIGSHYLDKLLLEGKIDPSVIDETYVSASTVELMVMEANSSILSSENQVIYVAVVRNDMVTPVQGATGTVTVYLPGSSPTVYYFEPTSKEGFSMVTLPATPGLGAGTVISYEVCLDVPQGSAEECKLDGYLILNYQP